MILARQSYLAAERAIKARSRRKRYVMGQTLVPVGRDVGPTDSGDANPL